MRLVLLELPRPELGLEELVDLLQRSSLSPSSALNSQVNTARMQQTLSSGKKRKLQMTEKAATEPKIQPILTPIEGSRYGVQKVTRKAAATSHAVPNAYASGLGQRWPNL